MSRVSHDIGDAQGNEVIDFRSDSVTLPTEAMWEAMRRAPLGWANVGEDPSVNELQDLAADLTGKQSALFVPTGAMANLLALMSHTQRGDQIILEASSHILGAEEWGLAYICGLVPRVIKGDQGYMAPEEIQDAISERQFAHHPQTSLICIENTHNVAGGTILSPTQISAVAGAAREHGIPVHLDGARLFNACVALGEDLRTMAADVDTLILSLGKGLSAPGGAMLCGPKNFIERSRVNLKRIGGASMHQAGIYAAAGLVALRTMMPRLAEDHRRARLLEGSLAALNLSGIRSKPVQTNIVMVQVDKNLTSANNLLAQMAAHGVLASLCLEDVIRFVTHRHIDDEDVQQTVSLMRDIVVQRLKRHVAS